MINAKIDQFLDTGWYSESTLFYKGYIYWLEAQSDEKGTVFFIDKWEAENENNLYYHSLLEADGTLPFECVLEIHDNDLDLIKKRFLEAPVFEGRTFWQVEKEIVWLDDGGPKVKEDKRP